MKIFALIFSGHFFLKIITNKESHTKLSQMKNLIDSSGLP